MKNVSHPQRPAVQTKSDSESSERLEYSDSMVWTEVEMKSASGDGGIRSPGVHMALDAGRRARGTRDVFNIIYTEKVRFNGWPQKIQHVR